MLAYGYLYNLQGDVVALVDGTGTRVVQYGYDAWGKPISKTGSLAATLGTVQPFRYRGYVFDEETGDYYLRARYYWTEWGRFVSADTLMEGDLYCYCNNQPITLFDRDGFLSDSSIVEDYALLVSILTNEKVTIPTKILSAGEVTRTISIQKVEDHETQQLVREITHDMLVFLEGAITTYATNSVIIGGALAVVADKGNKWLETNLNPALNPPNGTYVVDKLEYSEQNSGYKYTQTYYLYYGTSDSGDEYVGIWRINAIITPWGMDVQPKVLYETK